MVASCCASCGGKCCAWGAPADGLSGFEDDESELELEDDGFLPSKANCLAEQLFSFHPPSPRVGDKLPLDRPHHGGHIFLSSGEVVGPHVPPRFLPQFYQALPVSVAKSL